MSISKHGECTEQMKSLFALHVCVCGERGYVRDRLDLETHLQMSLKDMVGQFNVQHVEKHVDHDHFVGMKVLTWLCGMSDA